MAKMRNRSFHRARRMRWLAETFVVREKAVLASPCTVQTPHLAMPRPMGVRDLRRRVPPRPAGPRIWSSQLAPSWLAAIFIAMWAPAEIGGNFGASFRGTQEGIASMVVSKSGCMK